MYKIIVSLVRNSFGIVRYLKKVALSIIIGYVTLIIPSRDIHISVSHRRLFSTELKWRRFVTLLLFPDAKVITARYWFDYARVKHSLLLPLLVNESTVSEFFPL